MTIAANEQSGSVVVTNTGSDEVIIQVRPYTWSQNGEESRADTRELIVNPPIFKLIAGEQQLVRVASRTAPAQEVERAYRLVFSEIPPANEPPKAAGFQIRVAMDIPLYLEPIAPSTAQPAFRLEQSAAGTRLVATNTGGRHFRLRDVRVQDGDATIHTTPRIVILAKSMLAIELPPAAKNTQTLRLIGQDDADQPVSIEIAAQRAP